MKQVRPSRVLSSEILEESIVSAARSQVAMIRRLKGWTHGDLTQRVTPAKQSLDLLTTGGIPNYDDVLVALLYLLRYHYSHINLAWSSMAAVGSLGSANGLYRGGDALQVVDFGSGTSAMYVALVFFMSEALESGRSVPPVTVQSIEPSVSMRAMAEAFAQEFRTTVVSRHRSDPHRHGALFRALDLVEHSVLDDWTAIKRTGKHRWLSALHTVHDDPKHILEVKRSLGKLSWRLAPTEGLMTFHQSKLLGAIAIAPFKGSGRALNLEPMLPEGQLRILDQMCRDIGFIRHLHNPYTTQVYATPKDAAALHWSDLPPANMLGNPL